VKLTDAVPPNETRRGCTANQHDLRAARLL